jgi:DNA-binding response OmpR family regulator
LARPFDLVLMDLLLPGLDGMSTTREILRRRPDLPVVVVSALAERERMVEAFSLGVAGYVTKPFDVDVLLARITATLRRHGRLHGALRSRSGAADTVPHLELDNDARTLRSNGREVRLTPKEHGLLELLLSDPGHLFSKEEITESVWHHRYVSTSRTLDVHVRRLREKLRRVDARAAIIGVRGVGYRLVVPVAAEDQDPRSVRAAEPWS